MNVLFKLPREAVPPEEQCLKFIVQAPDKIRGRLLKAKRSRPGIHRNEAGPERFRSLKQN